jgi:hypothetical protein
MPPNQETIDLINSEWTQSLAIACGIDALTDPVCTRPGQVKFQIDHIRRVERMRERLLCINKICQFCAAGIPLEPNLMFHRDAQKLVASGQEVYSCDAARLWGIILALNKQPSGSDLPKFLKLMAAKVKDPEKVWTYNEEVEFLKKE